jgi:hypothetical protein
MAARYVWSGATGTGSGASWANAHVSLTAAITASSAGDTFYVAHDHAETTAAALTLTFKGTAAAPDRILCVNRGGSVPPVAADLVASPSGSCVTTGNNSLFVAGTFYCFGMIFSAGTGATGAPGLQVGAAHPCYQRFENCSLRIASTTTGSSARINFGVTGGTPIDLKNCKIGFGASNFAFQGLTVACPLRWVNSPSASVVDSSGGTPNQLFAGTTAGWINTSEFSGLDLSAFATLVFASLYGLFRFINCKLNASVVVAGTPTNLSQLAPT